MRTALTLLSYLLTIGILGGCAGSAYQRQQEVNALLQTNMADLSDETLLSAYYKLRRQAQELGVSEAQFMSMSNSYRTSGRISQAFGAHRAATDAYGNALATAIIGAMQSAQRNDVVTKAVEARVQLELRGWTPVLGFARKARTTTISQDSPLAPIETAKATEPTPPVHAPTTTPPTSAPPVAAMPASLGVGANGSMRQRPCHQVALQKDGTMKCTQ